LVELIFDKFSAMQQMLPCWASSSPKDRHERKAERRAPPDELTQELEAHWTWRSFAAP
jgi:hypothetical protein